MLGLASNECRIPSNNWRSVSALIQVYQVSQVIWLWSEIAKTLEGSTPILSLWEFVILSVEGTAAIRPHGPAEMSGNTTDLWQFFQQESHLGPPGSSSKKNVCQNEPQVWYLDNKILSLCVKINVNIQSLAAYSYPCKRLWGSYFSVRNADII